MRFIDTHTHLYSDAFDHDIDDVIKKAIEEGIDSFYLPAIDASYMQRMYKLEKAYPDRMFLMTGLHPTSVKENFKEELAYVNEQLAQRDFVGIGEIGIDLYWDKSYLKEQQIAFQTQIKWAKEKKLPIIIHSRDSFDEIFDILETEKGPDLFGIFHCFTGTLTQAHQAIGYNMKLGIGGVVTFKNGKIDQFLHEIPLENIVLETDAPYLAPVPFRGKRNEPAYLKIVAEKVAKIYNTNLETIARITTENALSVFGKLY